MWSGVSVWSRGGCVVPEGVHGPRGACSRGVCAPGGLVLAGAGPGGGWSWWGVVSQHALRQTLTPPVNRMTDRCENITLATTSLRPVKITKFSVYVFCFQILFANVFDWWCYLMRRHTLTWLFESFTLFSILVSISQFSEKTTKSKALPERGYCLQYLKSRQDSEEWDCEAWKFNIEIQNVFLYTTYSCICLLRKPWYFTFEN